MLVLGRAAIVTAQRRAGEGILAGVSPVSPYEAELYRPTGQTESSTAAIQSTSYGATVLITNQGLDPSQVTIQAAQAVTWVNPTSTAQRLVSGKPYRVYLPLILRNAGSSQSIAAVVMPDQTTTSASDWGDEITPGGTYTHTFVEAGGYFYFIAAHPDWTGQVEVHPPTPCTVNAWYEYRPWTFSPLPHSESITWGPNCYPWQPHEEWVAYTDLT